MHLLEADSLPPPNRTRRVIHPERHRRVDVFGQRDILLNGEHCFVDNLTQDSRQHHPHPVLHDGNFLFHRSEKFPRDIDGRFIGIDRRRDFHNRIPDQRRQCGDANKPVFHHDPLRLVKSGHGDRRTKDGSRFRQNFIQCLKVFFFRSRSRLLSSRAMEIFPAIGFRLFIFLGE